MIPFGLKGKLIAGGVIAVLALGAGWKINGWRNDAARLDQVEAQIAQYREDFAAAEAAAAIDEREAGKLSGLLEDIRRERDIALDELETHPTLTRTVTKVLRDDCPVCNCPALGSDFRAIYNGMRKRAHETATNTGAPAAGGSDAAVPESLRTP